jgi:hypothetical protein
MQKIMLMVLLQITMKLELLLMHLYRQKNTQTV